MALLVAVCVSLTFVCFVRSSFDTRTARFDSFNRPSDPLSHRWSSLRNSNCAKRPPQASFRSGKRYPVTVQLSYVTNHHLIAGWMEPISAYLATYFAELQREWSINGGVAEVGVHHGKFFLALVMASLQEEEHIAIDLFEDMQGLNVDLSGRGSPSYFKTNLRNFSVSDASVTIWPASSANVSEASSMWTRSVRMWSVDGGHTPELTFNDLVRSQHLWK